MLGQAECTDERACPLHHYWKPASERYLATLQGTTLADLKHFCEHRPDCGYPMPHEQPAPAKAPVEKPKRSRAKP